MYRNNKAMLRPGSTMPTMGTNIDGKYDAIMNLNLM